MAAVPNHKQICCGVINQMMYLLPGRSHPSFSNLYYTGSKTDPALSVNKPDCVDFGLDAYYITWVHSRFVYYTDDR